MKGNLEPGRQTLRNFCNEKTDKKDSGFQFFSLIKMGWMDGKWFWMVHKHHSWCTHLSNRSFLGQGHSRWYGPQKPNKIQDSDSVNGGESETFDINLRSITIRLNAWMDSLGWILGFGYILMHSLFGHENKTRTKSSRPLYKIKMSMQMNKSRTRCYYH